MQQFEVLVHSINRMLSMTGMVDGGIRAAVWQKLASSTERDPALQSPCV